MVDDETPTTEFTLRHYTDEAGRAAIEKVRTILPGSDGRIYLTRDVYRRAVDAQARLSLLRRPTGYFEIRTGLLSDLSATELVLQDYGQPGGGTQVWVTRPIHLEVLSWVAIVE